MTEYSAEDIDALEKVHCSLSYQVRSRDHPLANLLKKPRLTKRLCLLNSIENFFTKRVGSMLNEQPNSVISATSTNAFKNKFDKFRSEQSAVNFTTIVRWGNYFMLPSVTSQRTSPGDSLDTNMQSTQTLTSINVSVPNMTQQDPQLPKRRGRPPDSPNTKALKEKAKKSKRRT
ncbi:hypothetical protein BpHYR1_028803 [Brachionus plicatilis]|uniref:Uncharacterized protein n=1 Tax=Brachionus plicatilis TaxID=10195 RepID=A0A3M7P907_BRAPC|nr:hypothetical protein BpHYR1_028803 [Brachionus plicatilis]